LNSLVCLTLSDWAALGEIATGLASLFAIVIALLSASFVRTQVLQGREDMKVGLITGMTEQMLEIDRALIEFPTMRKYFGDSARVENDGSEESERARAIAFALANSLDHVVTHFPLMEQDAREAWEDYIQNLHRTSPVFAQTLTENEKWWPRLQRKVWELAEPPLKAPR
jgi:hypothetical protein